MTSRSPRRSATPRRPARRPRRQGACWRWSAHGHLRVARTIEDIDAAADGGLPAAIMHLEGAEAIDEDLEALDQWHAAGLRSLGPVWSRPNAFGHGVPFRFPSTPDTGEGLTAAGRALVTRCNALGIAVDVSHLNTRGFWDVAETTDAPIIASHCGAHALAPASRNLTDDQLDAVGASGGIVGIPYIVDFLRADGALDRSTPLSTVVAHVRHVADRIGVAARRLRLGLRRRRHPRRARRRRGAAAAARRLGRRRLHRARRSPRSPGATGGASLPRPGASR